MQLEDYRVGSLRDLYVIQEYFSREEEAALLTEVRASRSKWTSVSGRRLQNHGGVVHKGGLLKAALPRWLEGLVARVSASTGIFNDGQLERSANHVLVNAYQPGEGILPHEDGPLYHPAVAILSLGAPAVVRFTRKRGSDGEEGEGHGALAASVVVLPRSLLVFRGEAYTGHLHGIDAVGEEAIDDSVVNPGAAAQAPGGVLPRGSERVSLTVRRVLREHAFSLWL